jgi:chromate transporter
VTGGPTPAPRARASAPPTAGAWLRVNLTIGTLSFGSGSRIVLYEDAVVRKRGWLSSSEFEEVLTIAQLLPGPNLVNLSAYLGYRLVGVVPAVLGVLCLCVPGAVMAVALSAALATERPWASALLRGMAVAGLVLLLVFVWRRIPGLRATPEPAVVAPRRRVWMRAALLAGVATASLGGVPLLRILAVALPLTLLLEFLL